MEKIFRTNIRHKDKHFTTYQFPFSVNKQHRTFEDANFGLILRNYDLHPVLGTHDPHS